MLETREAGVIAVACGFAPEVDLDLLSHCSCSICIKKGILHLGTDPATFQLLRGKNALTSYTFGTGVAQHTFCSHCGMHAFYIPRGEPASHQRQCPLPGRHRRAELEAHPVLRRSSLARTHSAAESQRPARRRRPMRTARRLYKHPRPRAGVGASRQNDPHAHSMCELLAPLEA